MPIIVTLITFDLIYSKLSERCPTPWLGITTRKSYEILNPPPTIIQPPPLIKKF